MPAMQYLVQTVLLSVTNDFVTTNGHCSSGCRGMDLLTAYTKEQSWFKEQGSCQC